MALHGSCSGKIDIKSPVDKFFKSFTDNGTSPTGRITEKEEVESIDWEKRTMTIRMTSCLISTAYNSVKATIAVTPKEDGDGGQVLWTVQYEKIRCDIGEPQLVVSVVVHFLKETDKNLLL